MSPFRGVDNQGAMLLDTNIVISCKSGGEWLAAWTNDPAAAMASVTLIESLGYAGISDPEDAVIRKLTSASLICPLDDEIIERAIQLRRRRSMKLGDAIIAATALEYDLPLVTRNTDDFKHIDGLRLIDPFAGKGQA